MREAAIESAFARKASKEGWMTHKLDASKISRGWPDRLVCLPANVHIFIEFKTPTGKVTPLQAHRHSELRALAHIVYVCRSWQEAMDICKGHLI